jgi:hypothetical protein
MFFSGFGFPLPKTKRKANIEKRYIEKKFVVLLLSGVFQKQRKVVP